VHVVNEGGVLLSKYNPVITYNANLSYCPMAYNDTVYVIGDAGKDAASLFALNMDGTLKWKLQFNSSASPVIYTGKDIVCVDTEVRGDGQLIPVLYVIDGRGGLKFTYNSGDGRRWEQVYVGPDDTVYAKTYGGRLYALKG
jgi:outer membrane protein assembly factor BamB